MAYLVVSMAEDYPIVFFFSHLALLPPLGWNAPSTPVSVPLLAQLAAPDSAGALSIFLF